MHEDFGSSILAINIKNLTICSDTENYTSLFSEEKEMICNNNLNDDLNIKKYKCYMRYIFDEFPLFIKHSCEICGNNFFQIYNDSTNNNSNINCYNSPDGYYLDLENSIYKPCYFSCKTCDKNGD